MSDSQPEPQPVEYAGCVAIEWPAVPARPDGDPGVMLGALAKVFDARTGRPIYTVTDLKIHADPNSLVTAELTMFADEDGKPLFELEQRERPASAAADLFVPAGDDGRPRTGTFPFLVSEMRVQGSRPVSAVAGAGGSSAFGCGGGAGGGRGGTVYASGGIGVTPGCYGGGGAGDSGASVGYNDTPPSS